MQCGHHRGLVVMPQRDVAEQEAGNTRTVVGVDSVGVNAIWSANTRAGYEQIIHIIFVD